MLAAIKSGDAKELAELIRQDPGFNVNMRDASGRSLLHHACRESLSSSPMIPVLLARSDIDVNLEDNLGHPPFHYACRYGHTACVREMLKDSRVTVNEADYTGYTPLWRAARYGYLDIVKWWIGKGNGSRETRGFRPDG